MVTGRTKVQGDHGVAVATGVEMITHAKTYRTFFLLVFSLLQRLRRVRFRCQKVEPPNWWAGLPENPMLLLVWHGSDQRKRHNQLSRGEGRSGRAGERGEIPVRLAEDRTEREGRDGEVYGDGISRECGV